MHAADKDNVGPGKVGVRGPLDILINETDLPALRQISSDDQQTLRRHEGAYARHERKGVSESAEGRRVRRKNAKDVTTFFDGNGAAQASLLTSALIQCAPQARLYLSGTPGLARRRTSLGPDTVEISSRFFFTYKVFYVPIEAGTCDWGHLQWSQFVDDHGLNHD